MGDLPISRRRLLQFAATLPALTLLLNPQQASGVELICTDKSHLNAEQQEQRTAQHYVDVSPLGTKKNCDNCVVFQPAASSTCGSCLILAGPIHPLGYCDAWTDMA